MRSFAITVLLASTVAANSWFGASDPQPTPWTREQLDKAQKTFEGVKDDSFNSWNESRLRQFLLDNGVIEPKGTKEQLQVSARKYYSQYANAVSTLAYGDSQYQASKSASSASSVASKSATSVASRASNSAYSGASVASASATSAYAAATDTVARNLDITKDYVYSTWDENQLRSYLEEHGVIKTKQQAKKDELLAKVHETYVTATTPVYNAWADSYIREWLIAHNIIVPPQTPREKLLAQMKDYYYDTNDRVWSTWSDSEMKEYLVNHNIIKSNAEIKREKANKLVADNWNRTSDAFWSSWTDSEIRAWLVEHGYVGSETEIKTAEAQKLFREKYNDTAARTADWTTWQDARLRAYLRMHGVEESALPTDRPTLLHETRIRYLIAETRINSFLNNIRRSMSDSVEAAEERLGDIVNLLKGAKDDAEVKRKALLKAADKSAAAAEASATSLRAEATKIAKQAKVEL